MVTIGKLENMHSVLFNLLEKIMAKKKTGKPETSVRVIKQTLTKSALIELIAEQNDIPRKTAIGVFNTLESVMLGSVHPRGVGEFTLPGLLKITLRKVPARKAGTLIRNPATGEMMKGAAKPASMRVKIRALSKLQRCRDILISNISCKRVSFRHKTRPAVSCGRIFSVGMGEVSVSADWLLGPHVLRRRIVTYGYEFRVA